MSWKKVVVSGSNAHLSSIGVNVATPATAGEISASGKLYALTTEDDTLASFDVVIKGPGGEFMHTASAAINPALENLTISTGLLPSSTDYNGSTATTISVDSSSLAGNGLNATTTATHTAGFEVEADSSADTISVTSAGIAVKTGSLAGAGLSANDSIISGLAIGGMGVVVDGTTITINGSGQLQAEAGSAANALTNGNGIQTLSYDGGTSGKTIIVDTGSIAGAGLTGTSGDNGFTNNKISVKGTLSGDGTLQYTGGEFVNSNIFDDGTTGITLGDGSGNYTTTIPGDLTVQGTAKFINSTNLSTADDFFLMSSGSTVDEAFGILGQTSSTTGTGWMYGGSANRRWTMTKDANVESGGVAGTKVGDAALVVASTDPTSTDATYEDKNGNMLVDSSGNIYLYF